MRIATWNVEYAYPVRMQKLQAFVQSKTADIWVLTETHDDLQPPNCPHAVHAEQRYRNWSGIRDGSRWVSIWSRYPVIEQIQLDDADNLRTVCARFDTGDGNDIIVYGTVLPWHPDRGPNAPDNAPPHWSEHNRIIPMQIDEWKEIRRRHPTTPLFVAGDFNTDMADGKRYGTALGIELLQKGFSNSDIYCATEPLQVPKGLLPVLPIDHIAIPATWSSKIADAWPAQKGILSDHSGIIVEVKQSQ